MGLFKHNSKTIQEEERGLESQPTKIQQNVTELQQSLVELDCEEAIINEKEQFGRVRNSMMRVLRAKYGSVIANRTLNRVNKRMQKRHFQIN